jgi:hypothetical protein
VSAANDLTARINAYTGNTTNTANTIAVDLSALFAQAGNPAALVAQVNHDLMYGSMSAAMQTTLAGMVGLISYNAAEPQSRVLALLQVVLASPEFAIQK